VGRKLVSGGKGAESAAAEGPATPAEQSRLEDAARRLAQSLPSGPVIPSTPRLKDGLAKVVETVFAIDIEETFNQLEATKLYIDDALTPPAVRAHLNRADEDARRAYQLYCAVKLQVQSYVRDCEPCIGAMRRAASAALTRDKALGKSTKQITEDDIRHKMAALFPDQYTDVFGRIDRLERAAKFFERYAELWKNRAYTLSSLNK
jgi:hypothetical protein